MSNFLDQTGLAYFWQKIKTLLSGKLGTSETAHKTSSIPMGKVDSTSTSTDFTATVDGITELRNGVCMWLTNGTVSSESGFTININNLGAKPVYNSMAVSNRITTVFKFEYTMLFVYNETRASGGCWDCVYGYYNNTDSIGYQIRHNSGTLKASEKTYRYRLLFTGSEDTLVPANTSNSTNATAARAVNQTPIDPFGPIYYYGATTAVNAGSSFEATTLWQQYTLFLGYSFNMTGAALTLTYPRAVYVKATPTNDGKAIIDADTPYVQTLPSTEDGKIYIYLGQAYTATSVELDVNHPVYYYSSVTNCIQLYTGSEATTNIQISNRMSWTTFTDDTLKGQTWVSVPANAREVYVEVYTSWNTTQKLSSDFYLPINGWVFSTSSTYRLHVNHWGQSWDGLVGVETRILNNTTYQVRLYRCNNGNTDQTNNTYWRAFYR